MRLEPLLESTESKHLVLERNRSRPISIQESLLLVVIVIVRGLLSG